MTEPCYFKLDGYLYCKRQGLSVIKVYCIGLAGIFQGNYPSEPDELAHPISKQEFDEAEAKALKILSYQQVKEATT